MRWNAKPEISEELELTIGEQVLPLKFYRSRYDGEPGEPYPQLEIECFRPLTAEEREIAERKFWRWYHKTYGR